MKKLDYFFIARPMLFFPGWNTLLAGYLAGSGELFLLSDLRQSSYSVFLLDRDVIYAMLSFMLAMGGSFILNQVKDVASDRKNRKLFLIGEGFLSQKSALFEAAILLCFSITIAAFMGISFLTLIVLFILISSYLYNFRPFQYKNRPFAGFLLNVLGGWLAFSLGWVLAGSFTAEFILHSLPYIFLNTSLIFLTIIPDAAGDLASGKQTFCVRYGVRTTVFMSAFFYILSLMSSVWVDDQMVMLIDLFLLFHLFQMLRHPREAQAVRFLKMGIFYFSMVICLKFPLYFILMVLVFFITRYYYGQRFQFDYPNFRGE